MRRSRPVPLVVTCLTGITLLAVVLPGEATASPWITQELIHPADVPGIDTFGISADTRWVAFLTEESLAAADTDLVTDAYLLDRSTDDVTLVSTDVAAGSDDEVLSATISGDGDTVVFASIADTHHVDDTNAGGWDVFAWHRATGTTEVVSARPDGHTATGDSYWPSVDHDGRYVAFESSATDLVANDTNNWTDVFVRDLTTDTTERVSVTSTEGQVAKGGEKAWISGDGQSVSFTSTGNFAPLASNGLPQIYLRNRTGGTTHLVSRDPTAGAADEGTFHTNYISRDGMFVVFSSTSDDLVAGDAHADIQEAFIWDRFADSVSRVATLPGGTQPDVKVVPLGVSPDGDVVAVQTVAALRTDDDEVTKDVLAIRRSTGNVAYAALQADGDRPSTSPDIYDVALLDDLTTVAQANGADLSDAGGPSGFPHLFLGTACTWDDPAFPDVPASHPFACDVAWAVGREVADGYANGTFQPGRDVTRQAMAAFLHGLLDGGNGPDPGFSDVPPTHPFFAEISWLVDAGIAEGYPDGTFRPTSPIARQAMAAFLYRAAGAPLGPGPTCGESPFSDVPVSHPFCGEIAWMVSNGLTTGYPDGTFRPTDAVTRQATVAFLQRFHTAVLIG